MTHFYGSSLRLQIAPACGTSDERENYLKNTALRSVKYKVHLIHFVRPIYSNVS